MAPFILLLLVLAVVTLVLAGAWLWFRSRPASRTDTRAADHVDTVNGWAPQVTRVLSGAERDAFDLLRTALPAHTILAQVPLARFIKVPTRNSYSEWLRRVGHQCADFVVCDRHAQVVAVVELKNENPNASERVLRRQRRFMRVLAAADIPVHVWSEAEMPGVPEVREAIVLRETIDPGERTNAMPMRLNPAGAGGDEALREPPPSTWFDDLETEAAPLDAIAGHARAPRA